MAEEALEEEVQMREQQLALGEDRQRIMEAELQQLADMLKEKKRRHKEHQRQASRAHHIPGKGAGGPQPPNT